MIQMIFTHLRTGDASEAFLSHSLLHVSLVVLVKSHVLKNDHFSTFLSSGLGASISPFIGRSVCLSVGLSKKVSKTIKNMSKTVKYM